MSSQSILKHGVAEPWQVELADRAIDYKDDGTIYQQCGAGMQSAVIHACRNFGEPFDSARHRAAKAVWSAVEGMSKPENMDDVIDMLREVWEDAQ